MLFGSSMIQFADSFCIAERCGTYAFQPITKQILVMAKKDYNLSERVCVFAGSWSA